MSTIHSISRPNAISYTVVGGAQKARVHKYLFSISIVILNRGGRIYREEALEELPVADRLEIISIEGPNPAGEIDSLTKKYPHVRFLLLHEACTPGEKVNLGIEEAQSKLVLVTSSDLRVPQQAFSPRFLEKVETRNALCALPVLKNRRMETIPSVMVPGFISRRMKIVPWNPLYDGMKSVFPFDYAGIYSKEKYRFSGGFDAAIRSPYWQKCDFGLRNFLWGEECLVNTALYFQYRGEVPFEENTPDEGYKVYYLKNCAVDFRRDRGVLPFRKFPGYFLKSGSRLTRALAEFRAARRWVRLHRYRFKTDAKSLVESWQVPE